MSRRDLLKVAGVGVGALALPRARVMAQTSVAQTSDLVIQPRASWGADRPPVGPLAIERPEDVRFLLVHHTASSNNYQPADVPGLLRSFQAAHTAPAKGWPDIAYNFLVDRFGVVWEGRAGSIDGPVMGSATGGSQGFAQLCCVIGDLESAAPTVEAEQAVVSLLAWLAGRYGIDPAGQTSFISRGSNRHPAGVEVVTATIAGHRDMSRTVCPGQFGVAMVDRLPGLVSAHMVAGVPLAAPGPGAVGPVPQPAATPGPAVQAGDQTAEGGVVATGPPISAEPSGRRRAPAVVATKVPTGDQLTPAGLKLTAAGLLTTVGIASASVARGRGLH